jgi:hypothetical protein
MANSKKIIEIIPSTLDVRGGRRRKYDARGA